MGDRYRAAVYCRIGRAIPDEYKVVKGEPGAAVKRDTGRIVQGTEKPPHSLYIHGGMGMKPNDVPRVQEMKIPGVPKQ